MTHSAAVRWFVALPLPPSIRDQLYGWTASLRKNLRFRSWVHVQDYHITLFFIGDTERKRQRDIEARLGEIAATHAPIRLTVEKCGIFGRREAPRILWAGVGGELESLERLQADIKRAMTAAGFPADTRPYRPHITLARTYAGSLPFPGIPEERAHVQTARMTFAAKELVLFRTCFGRSPMYEREAVFPLSAR